MKLPHIKQNSATFSVIPDLQNIWFSLLTGLSDTIITWTITYYYQQGKKVVLVLSTNNEMNHFEPLL